MKYEVNGQVISYSSAGERITGKDIILSQENTDLTSGKPWHHRGYTIERLFASEEEFSNFSQLTRSLLIKCWKEAGLLVPEAITLERYHEYAVNQSIHLRCVEKTKLLSADLLPNGIERLEQRISALMNEPLRVHNPYDDQRVFHFRVIRPNSMDNNPLHRDVWLEDYENCINLYIPVVGSNELSSLILAPGSHLWPESRIEMTKSGANINGQKFNVPAVTNIFGPFEMIRPNPTMGEVLIFSPYLIHGGAANLNKNQTRISIEVRLWKAV